MKRISDAQRAHVHAHHIPNINAIFARASIPEDELREAARICGNLRERPDSQLSLELTRTPDVLQASEASKRYSLEGAFEGNSNPVLCVDSGHRAY